MRHLINISGGKDSQCVAIWFAKHRLPAIHGADNVELIFCDTGHEAKITYTFIEEFVNCLPKKMQNIAVLSKGYTFFEQAEKYKCFPSVKRRFCTSELKVEPMIDYILTLTEDVIIYDGRRWEESPSRANLEKRDDYFGIYDDPKAKKYRPKDVKKWRKEFSADCVRPIISLTARDVFEFIASEGYKRNPLYDLGLNRVGCFPCIMCSFDELIKVSEIEPEKIDKIREIEQAHDTTFFGPDAIPLRYCKKKFQSKKGGSAAVPTIDETLDYAIKRRGVASISGTGCFNNFVKCE